MNMIQRSCRNFFQKYRRKLLLQMKQTLLACTFQTLPIGTLLWAVDILCLTLFRKSFIEKCKLFKHILFLTMCGQFCCFSSNVNKLKSAQVIASDQFYARKEILTLFVAQRKLKGNVEGPLMKFISKQLQLTITIH